MTTDSSQGKERDVVILHLVAGIEGESPGFITNADRFIVARAGPGNCCSL